MLLRSELRSVGGRDQRFGRRGSIRSMLDPPYFPPDHRGFSGLLPEEDLHPRGDNETLRRARLCASAFTLDALVRWMSFRPFTSRCSRE